MAVKHGNSGTIDIDTNALAEIQGWTYDEEDVAPAEITSMGDTTATPLPSGCKRGKGTISVLLDDSDTNGQVALETAVASQTPVTLHLYTEDTTGAYEYTGSAYIRKSARSVEKTKPNEMNFDFDGALARTVIS